MASRPGKNPFFDDSTKEDDDIDDMTFLKSRPSNYVLGNGNKSAPSDQEYALKRQQLLEERRRIEERTLQSAKASVALVYESEKVGVSTAEELVRQGEKLQNIDANLDSMNSTMRLTQKHITSMKSLFGGIKNYFSKTTNDPPPSLTSSHSSGGIVPSRPNHYQSKLGETIEAISNDTSRTQNHPSFARKGISFDDESQPDASKPPPRSKEIEKALDNNLDELGAGLGRLKNLAIGLGSEIEEHNEMIERIMAKEERAEETMSYQNRQMRQILKK